MGSLATEGLLVPLGVLPKFVQSKLALDVLGFRVWSMNPNLEVFFHPSDMYKFALNTCFKLKPSTPSLGSLR